MSRERDSLETRSRVAALDGSSPPQNILTSDGHHSYQEAQERHHQHRRIRRLSSASTPRPTLSIKPSDATNYEIPDDDAEIRDTIIKLAQYVRSLEEEISASKPKEMSLQQLAAAATKIASAACSRGIKKQMSV